MTIDDESFTQIIIIDRSRSKADRISAKRSSDKTSIVLTELPSPRVMIIIKKTIDQNWEPLRVAIACGYTTNTIPGPSAVKKHGK